MRAPSSQRGATLIGVLLLVMALSTLGLLGLRSSARQLDEAGAQVARERASHAAETALALARLRLAELEDAQRDAVLMGSRPQAPACTDPCRDCLPAGAEVLTDHADAAGTCLAPPCVRPGAVARLPDRDRDRVHWCRIPLRQLLHGADADATVSVWARNDTADALAGGSWTDDRDRRVVLTAIAEVGGARVIAREHAPLPRP